MSKINAKIIKHSVYKPKGCPREDYRDIVTYELEYPRFIHGEIMTHRVFSRNAQSSRAVPVAKTLDVNGKSWVTPIAWGANKAGMSSTETLKGFKLKVAKVTWDIAAKAAFGLSKLLNKVGLHKQWANRITEPFSTIKVVVTTTEIDNFFWLRNDPDAAQPEIVELANQMLWEYNGSTPQELFIGEWHLPYINSWRGQSGTLWYDSEDGTPLKLQDAIKISTSSCAQVSYRRLDTSIEKALGIYERLFNGPKPHLSPSEHQATPVYLLKGKEKEWYKIPGITHVDRKGNLWSANFKGWLQHRQFLEQKVQPEGFCPMTQFSEIVGSEDMDLTEIPRF